MLSEKEIKKLGVELVKEKKRIEGELKGVGLRDTKKRYGFWRIRFPLIGRSKDEDAQEVETYERRLKISHELEDNLEHINRALQKISAGTYGKCDSCGKDIDIKRLKIYPEAAHCMTCHRRGIA